MATALDDLNSLLSADEQAQFAALLKNPKFAEKTGMMTQFFKDYAEFVDPEATPAKKDPPAAAATTPPAATVTDPPAKVTLKTSPSADLDSIGALIDQRLTTFKETLFTKDDATKARPEILAASLKLSDDYAEIRETHREEFGERLNRPEFEKFVEGARGRYPSLKDAHDAFVNEKRIEVRVKKGVEEAVKQKTSSATVPAQTTSAALSPAQEIIRKAKAEGNGGNGETNVSRAAARLTKLMHERESADAA